MYWIVNNRTEASAAYFSEQDKSNVSLQMYMPSNENLTIDEYFAFKTEFPESKHLKEAEKYYNEASKFVENIKE